MEDFQINQSIAGSCSGEGHTPTHTYYKDSCQIDGGSFGLRPGQTIFTLTTCEWDAEQYANQNESDKYCYHTVEINFSKFFAS